MRGAARDQYSDRLLTQACKTHEERLDVWTLLDTGLRVGEFSSHSRDNIDWQGHRLMIYGKGGPYGSKSKRRIVPLTARVQPLIEGHFALHDPAWGGLPHHSAHSQAVDGVLKVVREARGHRPQLLALASLINLCEGSEVF